MVPRISYPPRVGMSDSMEVHLRDETELLENKCGGKGFRLGSKAMLKALNTYYPYYLCVKCFTKEDAEEHKVPYGTDERATEEQASEQQAQNTPFSDEGGAPLVYTEA